MKTGTVCRLGLSLVASVMIFGAVVYSAFNIDRVTTVIADSISQFTWAISIPVIEMFLIVVVSIITAVAFLMCHIDYNYPEIRKNIWRWSYDSYNIICVVLLIGGGVLGCGIMTIAWAFTLKSIYLCCYIPTLILIMTFFQYERGWYKHVCKWITKHE
jgi:hypothetical protein